MSQQDPWEEALDLWDCLGIFASVVFPPLVVLAIAQWFIRRSKGYQRWTERVRRSLSTWSEGSQAVLESRQDRGAPLLPSPGEDRRLDLIPHLLDQKHILLVGHTGGGKTTLLHAVAREAAAQGHHVLVCDPDAIQGRYPGYRCLGAGDDYGAIARALETVQALFTRRSAARAAGQREFAPAWVLVDEAQEVIAEIPGAWAVLEQVIRRGRKLHLHCVIGSQDSQVRTLGLEGKSHLLVNLTRVDVMRDAGRRVARVGETTRPVPDLPNPDDTVTPDAAVLNGLLNDPVNGAERLVERSTVQGEPNVVQARSDAVHTVQPERSAEPFNLELTADERTRLARTMALRRDGKSKRESIETAWGIRKGGSPIWKRASKLLDLVEAGTLVLPDDPPPPPFRAFFGNDEEDGRKAA
jgi:energy-coupling factor transporter ATP-binding protein EcfA2